MRRGRLFGHLLVNLLDDLGQRDFGVCCRFPSAGSVGMLVMREGLQFRMMRGVVIGENRPIGPLVVITIIIIHGYAVLDPNHLIDIEIGPIEEAEARVDTTELVCDPLVGEFRLKSDDAFAFLQEPSQGGKIVVDCPHALTVF